ncbi:glutathione peroxidase [Sphingomonas solaris]|uniref:Glutathione peroxidase n=1 Tax=Alterirhizorhabdus solaris TaxID=2529389 RepID=A0A558QVA7_9SPHN|nr:glutathione peroxidase [Sphingomonas solaris]TVV71083.1 glutathione peroxidase [Sphingomonas solaris]
MATTLQDVPIRTIDGSDTTLKAYDGSVLLVVNVASKCGLTKQYDGLEALYRKYRDQGLVVLGFPANDFRGQEPGSDAEIADFCKTTYDVDFPLFSKISVLGPDKHPLYAALTEAQPKAVNGESMRKMLAGHGIEAAPEPEIGWNFEKFVVGRDGEVVGRFGPDTTPDDPALVAAIERELVASE